jgi:hypothetical protein
MAISDNIKARAQAVIDERQTGPSQTARELHDKAVKAITGGPADWVAYMKMYAGDPIDPDQLARLIPTDGTDDAVRQEARAYLVRNGMCLDDTTHMTIDHVDDKLDIIPPQP